MCTMGKVLEVGTEPWTQALRDAANAHPLLRELSAGFTSSIGLAFLEDAGHPTRRVVVDVASGVVASVRPVEVDEFDRAAVRLSATCDTWEGVLQGLTEPLRAIVLQRIHVEGNRLVLVRGLPTAKALIEAAKQLDADFADA